MVGVLGVVCEWCSATRMTSERFPHKRIFKDEILKPPEVIQVEQRHHGQPVHMAVLADWHIYNGGEERWRAERRGSQLAR
ncbi:hypothetical protein JCM16814_30990 [Desulfobaculum senezii]